MYGDKIRIDADREFGTRKLLLCVLEFNTNGNIQSQKYHIIYL